MTGLVFLRVRAHRLLLSAALLTVLLTTAVLATLTAYSATVGDAGLRNALGGSSAARASLVVKADVTADRREAGDAAVRKGAGRVFDGLPTHIRTLARSNPYALPRSLRDASRSRSQDPDLTHLAAVDRSRVELVSGRWPAKVTKGTGTVPVALPEVAAGHLRLKAGAEVKLTGRVQGQQPLTVRITGVYRPKDRTDPYWQLDELSGRGMQTVGFTTFGPLLADPSALDSGRVAQSSVAWLVRADFSGLTEDRIDALRAAVKPAVTSLSHAAAFTDSANSGSQDVTTDTELTDVLDEAQRALLVNRSTIVIVALQLVLLAGYALLLVARLLASEREGETDLLRARGGSRRRITGLAAWEAALLALPAGIAAPLLAGPLTGVLSGHGALARLGLELDTRVTAGTWLVGVIAAAGCALAVVAPTVTRTGREQSVVRRRMGSLPAPVRAGADLGLLAVAGVAYWQLDRQTAAGSGGGGVLGSDRSGTLGIDPVLVAAPALALLAGTVLTLRILPPVARLAERRAAAGRSLPAALAGWQLSRRPLRGAGPVLLLVLAVAMGMLAIGQGASWERSQDDQADFQAGTDVRISGMRMPQMGQSGVLEHIKGVREAAPASRTDMPLSRGRNATVLALDTRQAASGVRMRDDLADRPADELLHGLTPGGRHPGLRLPGMPDEVRLTLRLTSRADRSDFAQVTAAVQDAHSVTYTLDLGRLDTDGRDHVLTADLGEAAGGPAGKPAGPLRLTGLQLAQGMSSSADTEKLVLSEVRALQGGQARNVPLPDPGTWDADTSVDGQAVTDPSVGRPAGHAGKPLSLTVSTGRQQAGLSDYEQLTLTANLTAHAPRVGPIPAIATDRFTNSSGAGPGSVIEVPMSTGSIKAKIVKTVRAFPTTGPGAAGKDNPPATAAEDGGALVLDFRSLNRALADAGIAGQEPTEWWLHSADPAATTAALRDRADTDPAQVLSRDELARQLRDDPLGAGRQTALLAAAVVAAVLAALGFAVSVAGSLRERAAELAVLRALGAPRRQLARMIAAEQGVLLTLALAVGVALGTVLTRSVVPLISLTARAAKPVPAVLVQLPPLQLAFLLAAVAAVPLLIVAALALRRGDPAAELRLGGE